MKGKRKLAYGAIIEDPSVALYENQIARVKAEAEAAKNPWTTGLDILGTMAMNYGTSMMQSGMKNTTPNGEAASTEGFTGWINNLFGATNGEKKAFGGAVGGKSVEVEGKELAELPEGLILEFTGPSHEKGGIDTVLPAGTEVFSNRIKVNGETMADRKARREKLASKLAKLSKDNKTDLLLKNTMKRNKQVSDAENQFDLEVQQTVSDVLNPPKEKLAYGTGPYPFLDPSFWDWQGMAMQADPSSFLDMFTPDPRSKGSASLYETESPTYSTPDYGLTDADFENSVTDAPSSGKGFDWGSLFGSAGMPTLGDAMGMYGNWKQAKDINDLILENRAGDTPNINAFRDYGKDGLKVLQGSKNYVTQVRDENLRDLSEARATSSRRNRNTARGVNTMRALDLATDMGLNKAMSDIYSTFASQMLGIAGQEATMENQQDQMVMQGEQARDLADRQDRDNFYTQLITGRKGMNQAISSIGGNLNQIKGRETNQNLLNQMSDYAEVNVMNGTISAKEGLKLMGAGNPDNIVKRPAYQEFEKNKGYEGIGYTEKEWNALTSDQKAFVYTTKKKLV